MQQADATQRDSDGVITVFANPLHSEYSRDKIISIKKRKQRVLSLGKKNCAFDK